MPRARTLTSRFLYMKNDTAFSAWYTRRPPNGVPAFDTIALRFRRNRGKKHRFEVYMRPDEAVAIAGVLMTAVWRAIEPGRKRRV